MSQSLLGSDTFNHMSEFVFRRARPHWAESYPPYSGFLNWVSHFHARWTYREDERLNMRLHRSHVIAHAHTMAALFSRFLTPPCLGAKTAKIGKFKSAMIINID